MEHGNSMISDPVLLGILGLLGTLIAGFFKLISDQNKTHRKLATAIDGMAKASTKVAKATEKGADEAAQRNGHIVELILKSDKSAKDLADRNLKAMGTQNVTTQNVEHQHVSETKH